MKNLLALLFIASMIASCTGPELTGTSNEGQVTGKYNTMLIVDNFMYAVNNNELITLDLSDSANPVEIDKKDVGIAIENIYESEKVLFIGSQQNLHIYKIEANGIPTEKSETSYITWSNEVTPCDPVVAKEEIAYVTLSSSFEVDDPCGSDFINVNELRAYDVQNLEKPVLLNQLSMHSPKGMSIDGDYLFVSESDKGFKVYKMLHNGNLKLTGSYTGFDSYDLIAKDNKLLVVSPDEIRQYDYSDINDIVLYSTLSLR